VNHKRWRIDGECVRRSCSLRWGKSGNQRCTAGLQGRGANGEQEGGGTLPFECLVRAGERWRRLTPTSSWSGKNGVGHARAKEGKRKDGALYIEEELGWGPRASYTLGMSDDGSGGVALPGVI
jgi:hypothetical protein